MKVPFLSAKERARLRALEEYDLLDTAEEAAYDAFCGLAREIAGAAISLITLVDENRLWFKAHLGLDVREMPRDDGFCARIVEEGRTIVVADASSDRRFKDNPLVTGTPHVRFYAGSPLTSPDGYIIGSLCVMDGAPKTIAPTQLRMLEQLAQTLMGVFEKRRRYMSFFDAANIDVFIVEPRDTSIVFASRGACSRLRYSRNELLGMPLHDVIPGLDVSETQDLFERLQRGEHVIVDAALMRSDGSVYPVALRLDRTNENGSDRILIIAEDMTQRRLQQSEIGLLLGAIDAAGDVILVYQVTASGDLRLAYMNEAYQRQTGYTRGEAIGRTLDEFRQSMPDDEGMRVIREAIAAGIASQSEVASYRKDGSTYWNQVTMHPVLSAEGEVTHWISVERDITEEVARTSALAEEHDRLLALTRAARRLFTALDARAVVTAARDVVNQLVGAQGRVLAVRSDGAVAVIDELGAVDWSNAQPDDFVQRAIATRSRLVDEEHTRAVAPAGQFADARYALEVQARRAHPLRNTDLVVFDLIAEYFAVAARNVSLYQELDERRSAVLELNQTKSDLIAMLAHDFRGPLTSIVGFSELTGEVGEVNEEQRDFLDTIKRSALQLSELATDTLTLSRLERNEVTLQIGEVDVEVLVASIVSQYADRRKVSVDVSGDPRVTGDDERLRQVFTNLIDNAIKYSPEGQDPHVDIEGREDDVVLKVTDYGIGIPRGELSRVFDRFSRASNAKRLRIAGTGFGLFMTKQLVQLHGGTIAVESEEGQGSRFVVTLPRRVDRRAVPRTIVVFDLQREFSYLGYGLQEVGYRVLSAGALDEVVAIADSQTVDAVILCAPETLRSTDAVQLRAFSRELDIPVVAIGAQKNHTLLTPALTFTPPVLVADVVAGLERLLAMP